MRTIKFRGRVPLNDNPEGGTFAYGYLVVYDSGIYTHWLIRPNETTNAPVEPETIAQLVGYDSNGAEIYEGDTLIDEKGFTYTAFLQPSVEWEKEKERKDFFGWSGAPLAVAEQFAKLMLKEASEHANA